MYIGEYSGLDNDVDNLGLNCPETVHWNGKELKLFDGGGNNGAAFARTILSSFDRLSTARMKSMNSAGGKISAEKDKDGNSEIKGEVHVTANSDDKSTSVTASGEASVDNRGNTSGKVEVRVDHEF